MQLHSILFSLFLVASVIAKGDKQKSEKSQCKQIRKLQKFVDLASNTTKLEEVTNNNATKVAEIQAEASAAATQLTTLQSNATLVSDCAVINASEEQEDRCEETLELQAFIAFASNTTALAAQTNNNATKMAAIQAKASTAATKLQALTSNSTLQAACPAILQKEECKGMKKLEKFIEKANNQTLLDQATNGNTAKADKIKAEAVQAQAQLTELQSNKTFMDACAALGITGKTGKGIDSGASTEAAATSGKSSATLVQVGSIQFTMLSTILVVAAGMFFL
ncbi:hypothetical protein ONS95_014238 [Cadophora gregata]|uniref:uncharacterized protein n=1 Tax=Cadophora gregata TaxID=51156 RepID=UPI0026DC5A9B|nr:uncharacterized protein ONS95_014238 [Cadophora gregata]KAK0113997.1 hypothetical protein ONS96_014843 [Cadophora gregata f. sp. sojae]KAK0114755.1 hypothetical protein ONS95_014238 [Cadophora gregata]